MYWIAFRFGSVDLQTTYDSKRKSTGSHTNVKYVANTTCSQGNKTNNKNRPPSCCVAQAQKGKSIGQPSLSTQTTSALWVLCAVRIKCTGVSSSIYVRRSTAPRFCSSDSGGCSASAAPGRRLEPSQAV